MYLTEFHDSFLLYTKLLHFLKNIIFLIKSLNVLNDVYYFILILCTIFDIVKVFPLYLQDAII